MQPTNSISELSRPDDHLHLENISLRDAGSHELLQDGLPVQPQQNAKY